MWTKEITDGRPPRSERMTGLAQEQVADLVTEVSARVGVWQPPVGHPRAMGLYRAVVLTLFLLRHNNSQDVAGELFGCSQATISRLFTRLYPLLGAVNADLVAQVKADAADAPLLVDGFIAPTGERPDAEANMFSDKHHECGFNVQVVSDTAGRLVDVGDPVPGARHNAYAFDASGIAHRWAAHMAEDGPGLFGRQGIPGHRPAHPLQEATWPATDRCSTRLQPGAQQCAIRRRASHRPPDPMEDLGHRVARAAVRVPRPATHRHRAGDLPRTRIGLLNNAPGTCHRVRGGSAFHKCLQVV